MSRPYVTALIDTFNHERFIERAVTSVLEQDFPPSEMEVLVVDDGSSDATPEILARFAPRVRLLRKPNGGQASAFNFAIPQARGEIIAFLDGDDWWAPGKLARVSETMRAEGGVSLVGHGITEVRLDASTHTELLRETFRFRADTVAGARLFRKRKSFLGTSRMTLRAEMVRGFLPVPEELVVEADEYLFTLAAVASSVMVLPESLVFYRIHNHNLFYATSFSQKGFQRMKRIMTALAVELDRELTRRKLGPDVIETLLEEIRAEAKRLCLLVDGGWPWETVQTEWHLFCMMFERPVFRQRVLKILNLAPAAFLPPRTYYAAKDWLVRNPTFRRSRRKWLPVSVPSHVKRIDGTGI